MTYFYDTLTCRINSNAIKKYTLIFTIKIQGVRVIPTLIHKICKISTIILKFGIILLDLHKTNFTVSI